MKQDIKEIVQEYYGKSLQTSKDLKTSVCCTPFSVPDYVKKPLGMIHDEVMAKYYGCGLVAPEHLNSLNILDLGCGAGRDVYLLSYLVGEKGTVLGVDMTEEQLEVAMKYQEYHREKFQYKKSNVSFLKGDLEKLDQMNLKKKSFDVIVSNCVINLVPDKEKIFKDCFDLLKNGGEFYFSDVYLDRRMPEELKSDNILYGECISGAMYWNDFLNLVKKIGFVDPRLVNSHEIVVENSELREKLGNVRCYSATYRLFKIPTLENDCEDYGEALIYKGSIENKKHVFQLDRSHIFETGSAVSVCGNTADMILQTRFKEHFTHVGNRETHKGIFKGCGNDIPFNQSTSGPETGCC